MDKFVEQQAPINGTVEIVRAALSWIELKIKLNSREGCTRAKAKQKGVSHASEVQETFVEERFHLNQSGPFGKSWDRKQYLQCAMDGKSGASLIDFGVTKDEFVSWFKILADHMEAQGTSIKILRTDQAGENVKALTKLCNKKGINCKGRKKKDNWNQVSIQKED